MLLTHVTMYINRMTRPSVVGFVMRLERFLLFGMGETDVPSMYACPSASLKFRALR